MPKSRPDYPNYIRWMGFKNEDLVDELATLAISGGEKETDFFRIVPVPEKNINEQYSFKFFANGISHMSDYAKELVNDLQPGDPLYLMHDFQNMTDKCAIVLRTDAPPSIIGFVPAYLTNIIHKIREKNDFDSVTVTVSQVNKDAPFQKRLLCKLSSFHLNISWDEYEDEFKTLVP